MAFKTFRYIKIKKKEYGLLFIKKVRIVKAAVIFEPLTFRSKTNI